MLRFALPILLAAPPVAAEVRQASEAGFTSTHRLAIAAPPAKVWKAGHTYSGSAANLGLDRRASAFAAQVDKVLGLQWPRLKAAAER